MSDELAELRAALKTDAVIWDEYLGLLVIALRSGSIGEVRDALAATLRSASDSKGGEVSRLQHLVISPPRY